MIWIAILTKRQFKNPFLLALVILLPVTIIFSGTSSKKDSSSGYNVGLYIDGNSDFAKTIVDNLVNSDESFHFIKFDDVEEMKSMVISENIICGYVIPYDIREKLTSNEKEKCITTYKIPASTLQPAVNELLYAELIKLQGYYLLEDYISKSEYFNGVDCIDDVFAYYEKYLVGDETIKINYEEYGADGLIANEDLDVKFTFPIRGIMCVLVFLAGLFGSVLYLKDQENGVFQTITKGYQVVLGFFYPLIPALVFSFTMLVSMMCSSEHLGAFYELSRLVVYAFLITVFCFLLTLITRKSKTLSSCIPVILLCSLVFCPIFVNIELYFPIARYIQVLFMPFYYLKGFV